MRKTFIIFYVLSAFYLLASPALGHAADSPGFERIKAMQSITATDLSTTDAPPLKFMLVIATLSSILVIVIIITSYKHLRMIGMLSRYLDNRIKEIEKFEEYKASKRTRIFHLSTHKYKNKKL